jgi:DNA-directed RNA polymerase specialized sigma24 family protein
VALTRRRSPGGCSLRIEDESERQRASAERVRAYISKLTRAQFQDLTRRLVLYAARLLRGSSLDHHAYEIVTGAIDLALDGTRTWDPVACPFDNFMFGVVRSRASALCRSTASQLVKIAAQLPPPYDESSDILERVADDRLEAHTALTVEQEQEIERLIWSVAKIDSVLARVLVLALHEGMSNLEIAKELNVPVRDVENSKKRLRRAVTKLHAAEVAPLRSGRRH